MSKADYVAAEAAKGHDGTHLCHGNCGKTVPPALWGCITCWTRLPRRLRAKVWAAYRPGQEIDKQPSRAYLAVAEEVDQWVRENPLMSKKQPAV